MYLFQKIEELVLMHNDARKTIGNFILVEKESILEYSMKEIADRTYTSKPTLVRFAKSLGYNGWKEFIKAFSKEAVYQNTSGNQINPNLPFREESNTKQIISSLKNLQIESLMDTADLLDIKAVNKAADILYKANRIVIFGLNPNTFNAHIFSRKMLTIGKEVTVSDFGASGLLSRTLTSNDCAIIVCYSGNNEKKEPECYVKELKENNVPLIGITSVGENYLKKNIDCILTVSSRERLYSKIASFATDESIAFIFNILFACYFAKDYKKNLKLKIENSVCLEQGREALLLSMMEEKTSE